MGTSELARVAGKVIAVVLLILSVAPACVKRTVRRHPREGSYARTRLAPLPGAGAELYFDEAATYTPSPAELFPPRLIL